MEWHGSIEVRCPSERLWALLDDVQEHALGAGSPVASMTKHPEGPVHVGTEWRERIRVAPGATMTVTSVATAVETGSRLEERFRGPGMTGWLEYRLSPTPIGCRLEHRERVTFTGPLYPLAPVMGRLLRRRLTARLADIAEALERASPPGSPG